MAYDMDDPEFDVDDFWDQVDDAYDRKKEEDAAVFFDRKNRIERKTGLIMALGGIFEPGFSPSKVESYRKELDLIDQGLWTPRDAT